MPVFSIAIFGLPVKSFWAPWGAPMGPLGPGQGPGPRLFGPSATLASGGNFDATTGRLCVCLSQRYIRLQHSLCLSSTDIEASNTASVSITQVYEAPAQPLCLLHRCISLQHQLCVCYTGIEASNAACVSLAQIYKVVTAANIKNRQTIWNMV